MPEALPPFSHKSSWCGAYAQDMSLWHDTWLSTQTTLALLFIIQTQQTYELPRWEQ
jgi:hypothetical protein